MSQYTLNGENFNAIAYLSLEKSVPVVACVLQMKIISLNHEFINTTIRV